MSFQYLDKIYSILQEVSSKEKQNIDIAVNILTEKIKNKQQIFAFGASHAGILTQELFYRAGGLVVINPIFEPSLMLDTRPVTKTSQMERIEGFGTIIANNCKLKTGDLLIVHSVSGRNPVAIDLALTAKKKGVTIIAITNVKYSSSVTSRHSSGKRLFEVADLVIDNHGELGDACVQVKGLQQKVAPTSTVIGATILNIIVSETVKDLVSKNIDPPVFFSANVDGGDEHNKKILAEYHKIIHYQ
jgi:uncharacterized phosphosugar-binding protein